MSSNINVNATSSSSVTNSRKVRPQRPYRQGQRPIWAPDGSVDNKKAHPPLANSTQYGNSMPLHREHHNQHHQSIRVKSLLQPHQAPVLDDKITEAIIENNEQVEDSGPTFDTSALEVPEPIAVFEEAPNDDDEDVKAVAQRRLAWKQKILAEEAYTSVDFKNDDQPASAQIIEKSDGSEESDEDSVEESEFESESDAEEGMLSSKLAAPRFVPKTQRRTVAERIAIEEAAQQVVNNQKKQSESQRKDESASLLISAIERESASVSESIRQAANLKQLDDSDSLETREQDIEMWQVRELKRVMRDRKQRTEEIEEQKEALRRRGLSDVELIAERAAAGLNQCGVKSKIEFMQKYYHKGAFYTGDLEESGLSARDYTVATGVEAGRDKSLLPKVLQVKNFGFAGRSKYTHLADQDTTAPREDNPWGDQDQRPSGFHSSGTKRSARSSARDAWTKTYQSS